MTVETNANTITIHGDIINNNDFQSVRDTLEEMKSNASQVTLKLLGTKNISSALVGYLLKVHKLDHCEIKLLTDSRHLIELLEFMNLKSVLKIELI